jgi:AbrB family looped-hinge helix DNA binding protein
MTTVTIKPDGRVLIPARLRAALGAEAGEPLLARIEDGRLILERRSDALRRVQERFIAVRPATGLVDELLADRRAERDRER